MCDYNEQEMKNMAINNLNRLSIYKPYIREFEKTGIVTLFENYGGFYIGKYEQELELYEKIKELEKSYGILVYAVTHELFEFGECYTMLCISKYKGDFNDLTDCEAGMYIAESYVWNKSCEWCSEFGAVTISSHFGGIRRES